MKYLLPVLLTLLPFFSYAAPKAELWDYWALSDEGNAASISHEPWQQFLDRYVVARGENNLVRYGQVSKTDHDALKAYLNSLSQLDPRLYSKAEQYAYWVNTYNALTVDLILVNYPVSSITKLGGFFSFGPWNDDVISVSGKTLTLNDIEHRILRPIWQDPRTHYVVNCASLGCPNLQNHAFTADNSEQLLEVSAHSFINSSKGVQLMNSAVQLSSIYDWFIDDFGGKKGLIKHLHRYRQDLPLSLSNAEYDYDWSLNEE